MHFAIHYVTEYRYTDPVTDNLNALRVRPATTTTQRCDEFHLRTDPESRLGRHVDYFNTEVIEFGISQPHSSLTIDVRARVVTSEPAEPPDPPGRRSRPPPIARPQASICCRASPSRPTARSRSSSRPATATAHSRPRRRSAP